MHITKKDGTLKGTIVFIHGNSSSSQVFSPVFKSDLPYTIIAPDLPGHGESKNYSEKDYSIEACRKRLAGLMSSIKDEVLLVGHSLGGHYAIEIADEIENLKGLVIFGTPPLKKPINTEEAFHPISSIQVLYEEAPAEEDLNAFYEDAIVNKDIIPVIKKDYESTDPKVRTTLANDLAKGLLMDEVSIFSKLNIPGFVLHGERDRFINKNYLLHINKELKASCEFIEIKDSGHYPSLENSGDFEMIIRRIANQVFDEWPLKSD